MLQTDKQFGKFIMKSDFLILLIRAREGVFLLISCCDKLLGVASPSPHPLRTPPHTHTHTNTNTPSYHNEMWTYF